MTSRKDFVKNLHIVSPYIVSLQNGTKVVALEK